MRPTSEIVQEATKAQSYALMDETYNRMKQSANRIAFVLGIDQPLLDLGLNHQNRADRNQDEGR